MSWSRTGSAICCTSTSTRPGFSGFPVMWRSWPAARAVPRLVRRGRRAQDGRSRRAGAARPVMGRNVREPRGDGVAGAHPGLRRPAAPSGRRHRRDRDPGPRGQQARRPGRAGPDRPARARRRAAGRLAGDRHHAQARGGDAGASVRRPLLHRPVPGRHAGPPGAAARERLGAAAGHLGPGRRADPLPGGPLLPAGDGAPGHDRGRRPGQRLPGAERGEHGGRRRGRPDAQWSRRRCTPAENCSA